MAKIKRNSVLSDQEKSKPRRRIHVLHVVDSLRVGGLENGVVNMINALDDSMFRSSICCLKSTGELQSRLRDPGVKVFELHQKPGDHLFIKLAKILRGERVNILHSNNWGVFFDSVVGARLVGARLIVHCVHGLYAEDIAKMKLRRRLLQRFLSLGTHKLYAVADYLRDYYIRVVGVPARRISTIYNGVDVETYMARSQEVRRQEKAKLGFSPREILIGSVGTLYWVKDPQTLLTAAAMLLKKRDDVSFLWVGDGHLKNKLQVRAKELGIERKVLYLGVRDDIPNILTALDIFVLPSIIEGLSYSILEAMASSLPVVATDVGGNSELIKNGENGYLIPPKKPEILADVLFRLVSDEKLRESLGKSARQRVQEKFSLQEMVQSYQRMYVAGLFGAPSAAKIFQHTSVLGVS